MKTLLTLDEAFNSENIVATEAAVFNMSKFGVYDPNFWSVARTHANSVESRQNIENCIPYEGFQPSKVILQ